MVCALREHVQHPAVPVVDGHPPVQPTRLLCQAHHHHADHARPTRGQQRQVLLTLPARVETCKCDTVGKGIYVTSDLPVALYCLISFSLPHISLLFPQFTLYSKLFHEINKSTQREPLKSHAPHGLSRYQIRGLGPPDTTRSLQ